METTCRPVVHPEDTSRRHAALLGAQNVEAVGVDGRLIATKDLATAELEGATTADAIEATAREALLTRIHELATWNERIANGHTHVPRPPDLDAQVRVTVETILRSGDAYRPQPHRDVAVLKQRLAANVAWVPNLCVGWGA